PRGGRRVPPQKRVFCIVGAALRGGGAADAQEVRPAPPPKGWPATAQPGLFDEPNPIRHAVNATDNFVSDHDPADGVYAELGNMITGSGWISAGPGYRHHILGERAVIDPSAAGGGGYSQGG